MGKKKLDIMRQLQADWDAGAVETATPWSRQQIWEDAKFAKYAFNKSHSASCYPRDAHGLPEGALPERLHGRRAHQLHGTLTAASSATSPAATRTARRCCRRTSTPPRRVHPGRGGIRFGLVGVRGVGRTSLTIIAERRGHPSVHLAARFRELTRCESRYNLQDARSPHQGRCLRLHRLHPQAAHAFRGRNAASGRCG